MKNDSKQLIKHSMIYGTSDILNRILAFLLIPIYTRFLDPETYGILQVFVIITNIGLVIIQMGLSSAIFKSILYHENSDKKMIINTSFYFVMFCSIVILLPLFIFSRNISQWILSSTQYTLLFKILFVTLFFKSFSTIPLARFRIENASLNFSILITLKFLVQLFMNIVFVVILKKGLIGILISECIVEGIFALVFTGTLLKTLDFIFSIKEIKDLLGFGLPLVPAALAMFILTMSDRFFLMHYSNLENVGFYSIGYRFGMVIGILVGAFQKAWPSAMFTIARKENAKQIFSVNFTHFLFILFTVSLGLSLFSKEILRIMTTEKYLPGYKIIPLISLSFLCYGVYYYTSIGMNLKKKTIYQPVIVGISALLNLSLNWLFIPKWGTMGAATSTLISFIVLAIATNIISSRYYSISFQNHHILIIAITFLFTLILSYFVINKNIIQSIFIKLCLFFLYFIILILLGFFKQDEEYRIQQFIISIFKKNRNREISI